MAKQIKRQAAGELQRGRVLADMQLDGVQYHCGEVIEAADLTGKAESGEVDLHPDAVAYALEVGGAVRQHEPAAVEGEAAAGEAGEAAQG